MTESDVHEIRKEIISKASFILGEIFNREESPGVEEFRRFLRDEFDIDFINEIDLKVKIARYREYIDFLVNKGQLKDCIKKLLTDKSYTNLGPDKQKEIKEYQVEIHSLINKLEKLEKLEKAEEKVGGQADSSQSDNPQPNQKKAMDKTPFIMLVSFIVASVVIFFVSFTNQNEGINPLYIQRLNTNHFDYMELKNNTIEDLPIEKYVIKEFSNDKPYTNSFEIPSNTIIHSGQTLRIYFCSPKKPKVEKCIEKYTEMRWLFTDKFRISKGETIQLFDNKNQLIDERIAF